MRIMAICNLPLSFCLLVCLFCTLVSQGTSESSASILRTIRSIDEARRTSGGNATRHGTVTVLNGNNFIHLPTIMMYTVKVDPTTRVPLAIGAEQATAGILLALEHLNTGNGTLSPQVANLQERCNLKFTTEVFDTGASERDAVDIAVRLTSREDPRYLPSGYIGAFRSAESISSSLVTSLRGYPQVSATSTSTQLDNAAQFPLFARTIPTDAGTAIAAIRYIHEGLGVKHLAVLHVDDSYGSAYAAGLQLAAALHAPDMTVQAFSFQYEITPEIATEKISLLKATEYQYFFGIIFDWVHFEPIMSEAYKQGIAGTGTHHWMFSDGVTLDYLSDGFEKDSPLHYATRGTSSIAAVGGVGGRSPDYDKYLDALRDLNNDEDIRTIQSYFPEYPNEDYQFYDIESDRENFFNSLLSTHLPFFYDATIAQGLAACKASANSDDGFFDGEAHFAELVSSEFQGVSGTINLDPTSGTRTASSARFSLFNFLGEQEVNGTIFFSRVVSEIFQDGEWQLLEPFIYNDGTTNPPPALPPVGDIDKYIGLALRTTGLLFTGCIWFFVILLGYWTHENRKKRVVRASQPRFLGAVLGGCFLMSCSMIFLSIDDELVSEETAAAFCITVPWFFSSGWILVFSALFAKTKRVNMIFNNPKFRRITVTIRDVLAPVIVLQSVVAVVMTLWTVLLPPTWDRQVTELDKFGRAIETQAQCEYGDSYYFFGPLCVIFIGVLMYTLKQAYHARDVSTEYAESEYILLLLATMLLLSFIGLPTLLLQQDDSRARFFVVSALIFVVCMATMVLIFVPKFLANYYEEEDDVDAHTYISKQSFHTPVVKKAPRLSFFNPYATPAPEPETAPAPPKPSQPSPVTNMIDFSMRSESGGEGARVLQHPKKIEKLKDKVAMLELRNEKLMSQVERLQKLQNRAQSIMNMQDTSSRSLIDSEMMEKSSRRAPDLDMILSELPEESEIYDEMDECSSLGSFPSSELMRTKS